MKHEKKIKSVKKPTDHFRELRSCFYMVKIIARHAPAYLFFTMLEGTIFGIGLGVVNIVLYKELYDRLEQGLSFASVANIILLMSVISVFRTGYGFLYGWSVKQWFRQKLHRRMHSELFRKAQTLDLSCYDDPVFYNDFIWAINEADSRAAAIVEDTRTLIQSLFTSLTTFGLLLTVDPIIVVISILNAAINAKVRLYMNKIRLEEKEEDMPLTRKKDYVSRVMTLPEYAKETRTGEAGTLIRKLYRETMEEKRQVVLKYSKKHIKIWIFENARTYWIFESAVYLYLAFRLFTGAITLGGYAATTNAVWNLYWNFARIAKMYSSYADHSLYAEKYRTFLEYEPKIVGGDQKIEEVTSLTFDRVSFRYPGAEKDSLQNVSFSIRKGEKIAIVGYNGAGKTTLIKLLLRLYDPTDGTVRVNGTDVKEYDVTEYRDRFGTVFQDFQIFASSIAENVVAGPYTEEMKDKVITALRQSTFADKLEKLEKGINTPLTREFDDNGVNLSGGEAQKVAIARVFAHPGDVIVMDEPSSALDPMSEYELNQTILSYAENKTVIFISHRLSTTRMADRILMFADGKLIEDGSHEELMKAGGKYAEMFLMQAEKYTAQK